MFWPHKYKTRLQGTLKEWLDELSLELNVIIYNFFFPVCLAWFEVIIIFLFFYWNPAFLVILISVLFTQWKLNIKKDRYLFYLKVVSNLKNISYDIKVNMEI